MSLLEWQGGITNANTLNTAVVKYIAVTIIAHTIADSWDSYMHHRPIIDSMGIAHLFSGIPAADTSSIITGASSNAAYANLRPHQDSLVPHHQKLYSSTHLQRASFTPRSALLRSSPQVVCHWSL